MGIYYVSGIPFGDELYHHGIKGQKWGIRRYQNEDGSLTAEGKKRYESSSNVKRDLNRLEKEYALAKGDEYSSKTSGNKEKAAMAIKKQKAIQRDIRNLINNAKKQNMSVLDSPKARSTVRSGDQWIANSASLLTIPLGLVLGPSSAFMVGAVTGAIGGGAQTAYDVRRMGGVENIRYTGKKYKVK